MPGQWSSCANIAGTFRDIGEEWVDGKASGGRARLARGIFVDELPNNFRRLDFAKNEIVAFVAGPNQITVQAINAPETVAATTTLHEATGWSCESSTLVYRSTRSQGGEGNFGTVDRVVSISRASSGMLLYRIEESVHHRSMLTLGISRESSSTVEYRFETVR